MKTQPCEKCGKRYKVLTEGEKLCYYCHTRKYKVAPNARQFGNHDIKRKK